MEEIDDFKLVTKKDASDHFETSDDDGPDDCILFYSLLYCGGILQQAKHIALINRVPFQEADYIFHSVCYLSHFFIGKF